MQVRTSIIIVLAVLLTACVVAGDPEKARNNKASAINVQLGMGYLRQNNLELASEKLLKALRQDPDSAPAHNAYAILQDRLKQTDKAELHYKKATTLDPEDSQAANNYGAFLCRNNREIESEKYFLSALENPLYITPEYAYTNAALCLMKVEIDDRAREYLLKALATKGDFPIALIAMADLQFEAEDFDSTKAYVERFHKVTKPTAKSLWLKIRTVLEIDQEANVTDLAEQLKSEFPDSEETQSLLAIQ
jgi:type IV pilus assembly protein PilF